MHAAAQTPHSLDVIFAIWHRRKWLILLTFGTLLCATIGLVRTLPNIYEATGTVLIEQPQVPERFVTSTVGAGLETRLHTITQEVLSRSRLHEMIMRFNLYPELQREAAPESLADRMRADVRIDTTEVRRPAGDQATVAFAISYRGRNPELVAQVTNELAKLFVERNARIREQLTTGTLDLLQAQVDDVKRKLDEREREMAAFKSRHAGELAEQQAANLAALERLNAQLRLNIDRQLRVMEHRDELTGEFSGDPVLAPSAAPDEVSAQIAKLRAELADLRTRFTDEHPDVLRVKSQLAALEGQRAESESPAAKPASDVRSRRLRVALSRTDAELNALRSEEQALRRTIAIHQQRIENAPQREQELQRIARDYDTMTELHKSLLQRYQDAQLAERVEQRRQGEQFRILDPVLPPQQPLAPNRLMLLFMGLMLAGGAAAGVGILTESRDTSFHTVDDLRAFTTVPVLVTVPPIATPSDTRRHRARLWLSAAAAAGCIAAIAGVAAHLGQDNEMLVRLLTPGRF